LGPWLVLAVCAALVVPAAAQRAAVESRLAAASLLLDGSTAGSRLIVVGERGHARMRTFSIHCSPNDAFSRLPSAPMFLILNWTGTMGSEELTLIQLDLAQTNGRWHIAKMTMTRHGTDGTPRSRMSRPGLTSVQG